MKKLKSNQLLLLIMVIFALVAGGVFLAIKHINHDHASVSQERYEACLKEPVEQRSPNGCAPPGYCDAPADGYVKCDQ